MPIYEYQCTSCGNAFEKLVKMGAEPPPCPECGAGVQKKVSAAGFILKGGGWYKDHYGLKSGGGKSEGGSEGGATKSEGAPAAKSESAPAAKSDSGASASKPASTGGGSSTSAAT